MLIELLIELVVLPFGILMLAISFVRMMRNIRQVNELKMKRLTPMPPLLHRGPSDDFHDHIWLPLCRSVAETASSRLRRPLTARERRVIWRSRSALMLEVLLKELQAATDPETVASLLRSLPPGMNRPDLTGWCDVPVDGPGA